MNTTRSRLPVNVTINRSASTAVTPYGYNVNQRPNVVAGVPLSPPGGVCRSGERTVRHAGRHIARGPGPHRLDLRIGKQFVAQATRRNTRVDKRNEMRLRPSIPLPRCSS